MTTHKNIILAVSMLLGVVAFLPTSSRAADNGFFAMDNCLSDVKTIAGKAAPAPGEPLVSKFDFNNPHLAQPIQFYIRIGDTKNDKSATVQNLSMEFNAYAELVIPETLKPGQNLYCDGENVYLCDDAWKKIRKVAVGKLPRVAKGGNGIVVKCDFSEQNPPTIKIDFKTVGEPVALRGTLKMPGGTEGKAVR